jgi:uncharacterized protein (DUF111 family)
MEQTTTLGVRFDRVQRQTLARELVDVETRFGLVKLKIGRLGGREVNAAPEYESCRALALGAGVPVKEVYAAALAAWERKRLD